MPTTALTIGPIHTLVANQVYALPARGVRMRAQPFANMQVSNDGTTWLLPVFDTGGMADITGGFLRDTVGGALIKLSAY